MLAFNLSREVYALRPSHRLLPVKIWDDVLAEEFEASENLGVRKTR